MDAKYTPLKPIGKGAYGVVCSAHNDKGEKVAIKRIGGVFDNTVDAKRTLRCARVRLGCAVCWVPPARSPTRAHVLLSHSRQRTHPHHTHARIITRTARCAC